MIFAPMNAKDIDNSRLEELKKFTPLEYYEMDATSQLFCHILIANAQYNGLIDSKEWFNQVEYIEEKIKWVGRRGGEVTYFPSHREVESRFNIKINQARKPKTKELLNGWELEKVNLKLIKDTYGNILKIEE